MTMTDPMQKIKALCKKHKFIFCHPRGQTLIMIFDRECNPQAKFEIFGGPDQIYQKFLAVLQAMGWEPPTPTGFCPTAIAPGPDWYEVIDAASHDTLQVGDRVQMVESPTDYNNFLYRPDGTLHELQDGKGDYVALVGKPLPTSDAPETSAALAKDLAETINACLRHHCRPGGLLS